MGQFDPRIFDLAGYLATGILIVIVLGSLLTMLSRWFAIRSRQRSQFLDLDPVDSFSDLDFETTRRKSELSARINSWVERILNNPRYGARIHQRLMRAGIFNPNAVGVFILMRVVLALVLPIAFATAMQFFGDTNSPLVAVGLPIAMAVIGLFLPDYYVARRTSRYEDECRRGFPDLLDLLVVATDAGMGLEQAIGRVGNEIIANYPGLGANIYLMTLELRMGRGFSEALNNLVARTGVPEIRSFATLLQQSRELGSSVTAALRIYSDDMRHKRMSVAEEKAYALPAKMVLPLALFLFPVIVLIVMLPVIVRISAAFSNFSN
jgi:tight adherence protein C